MIIADLEQFVNTKISKRLVRTNYHIYIIADLEEIVNP